MNKKDKITKLEETRLWNLQHDNSQDGSMYYNEQEDRFRLRKKVDGKWITSTSSKSTLDAEIKMNLKEKTNITKERARMKRTFGDEISDFYCNALMKGYCGNNKRKIERKTTTITRQHVTIKNQILNDKISNQYMQSLLKRDFQEYFDRLEKSYSYSTIKKAYECIRLFFEYYDEEKGTEYHKLLRMDMLPTKESCSKRIMKEVKSSKNRDSITKSELKEQAEREVGALIGEDYRSFITICQRKYDPRAPYSEEESGYKWGWLLIVLIETGMRISEALALKWEDIDFEENTILINKNISRLPNAPESFDTIKKVKTSQREIKLTTPKTKSSIRKISMSSLCKETLLNKKDELMDTSAKNFIFRTSTGGVVTAHQVRRTIMKVLYLMKLYIQFNEIDVGEENTIGSHALRHSYATRRCLEGTPTLVIASELGHADASMVERIYANITSEMRRIFMS